MHEYADVSLTQESQPRFISSFPWCPGEMPADVLQGKHGVLKQTHTKEVTDASLKKDTLAHSLSFSDWGDVITFQFH